jgi:hypothetical protein
MGIPTRVGFSTVIPKKRLTIFFPRAVHRGRATCTASHIGDG